MPYPDFSTQEHRTIESRNPVAFVNLKYGANLISWPRTAGKHTYHATYLLNNRKSMCLDSNNNPLDMSLEDNVENNRYPGFDGPYVDYLGFDGQYHNYKGFIGKERNKYGKGMICEIWSDHITPNNHLCHPYDGTGSTTTISTTFVNSEGEYYPGGGVWQDKTNEGDWNNFNIYTQGMYLFSDVNNPGSDGDTYFMDGKNLSGGSKAHGMQYGNPHFQPIDNFEVIDTENGLPMLAHWDVYGYYYWKNRDDFNWGKLEGLENEPDQVPFGTGYYNRGFWVWCDNPAGNKYPIYSGTTGYNEARKFVMGGVLGSPYFNTETEEYINGIGGFEVNFNPRAKVTVVSGSNGNEIAYPMDYVLDHVDEALHSTSNILDIKDNTVSCFNHDFPGMTGYKMIGSMKNFEISKGYNFRVNQNTTMRIFEPKNLQESWLNGKDPEQVCENLGISYFPPRVYGTSVGPSGEHTAITDDYTSTTFNSFQMAKPDASVPPVLDFTDKSSTIAWNFDYSDTSLLGHTESTESFRFIVRKQTPGDIEQRSSVFDYDPNGFLFCKKNGSTITPLYYVGVDVNPSPGGFYHWSGGTLINVICGDCVDYGYRGGHQGGELPFIDDSFWTQNSSYIGESMGELFPYLTDIMNHSSGQHIHKAGNGGYSSGDGIVIYWYNRSNGMWYDVNLRLKSNNTKVPIPNYDIANIGGYQLEEFDVTGDGSKVCYWSFDLVKKT